MQKGNKKVISFLLVMVLAITAVFCNTKGNSVANAAPTGLSVNLKVGNSWQSAGSQFLQVDGTITNSSTSTANDWLVTVPMDATGTVSSSWNMSALLQSGFLSITGVSWNKSIPAGNSITFGMILENPGQFDVTKATITIPGIVDPTVTPTSTVTPTPTITSTPSVTITPTPITTTPTPITATPTPITTTPTPTTTPPPITVTPTPTVSTVPAPSTDDWLHTDGSKIYDKSGKEVWMTGLNWFGYNTGTNIFDGVWSCNLNNTIKEIANRGFNLIRVPFSSELILQWKSGVYPKANYNDYVNPYLNGMNSLQIFDYIIGQCRANGIKIMIDIHSAETNAAGHFAPLWYTAKISEADYLASLSWMADRYKNDDTIIAYDLKNEPHGAVGDTTRASYF